MLILSNPRILAQKNIRNSIQRMTTRFKSIVSHFQIMREVKRSRYYLANMSPHLLKDIGLSESDRQEEISKKFWHK
jgi:uncharacterized protein YjiS (DUF1127 family)